MSTRADDLAYFLKGLFGLAPPASDDGVAGFIDPAYVPTEIAAFVPTKPFELLNGRGVLRDPLAHAYVLRFNVVATDREAVIGALIRLQENLGDFFNGVRRTEDARATRRLRAGALVGFSAGFFRGRDSGKPRFALDAEALPRQLEALQLEGDAHDGAAPDLYVAIEATNRSLVLEAARAILRGAAEDGALRPVDWSEGYRREDGRDLFGFQSVTTNPHLESTPSVEDVVFCTEPEEPLPLRGSTYLLHQLSGVNTAGWRALGVAERERRIGITYEDGLPLDDAPPASLAGRLRAAAAPPVLERSFDFVGVDSDRTHRGIIHQRIARRPREQFERRHNQIFLPGDPPALTRDGVVVPGKIGSYILPPCTYALYPGQQFFEPELYRRFLEALAYYQLAEYEKAITAADALVRATPSFLAGYELIARSLVEIRIVDEALEWIARARLIDAEHAGIAILGAWVRYVEGDYESCVSEAIAALRLTMEESWRSFAYHAAGAALLELGRASEALNAFQDAARRVNLVPSHCFGFGNALDALGRNRDARTIYDRTVEVTQWLIDHGDITRRDVRTVVDLAFIRYRSAAAAETFARVKAALVASGL